MGSGLLIWGTQYWCIAPSAIVVPMNAALATLASTTFTWMGVVVWWGESLHVFHDTEVLQPLLQLALLDFVFFVSCFISLRLLRAQSIFITSRSVVSGESLAQ